MPEAAVGRCRGSLPAMRERIEQIRGWEVATFANRAPLVRRIRELCSQGATAVRC